MPKKKSLFRLLTVSVLFVMVQACDYVPNRSNIIAANRSLIDTGVRYIIVQRDTVKPDSVKTRDTLLNKKADTVLTAKKADSIPAPAKPVVKVEANINARADALVVFAKTMVGKPYVYGANTPEKGFDNGGFVNFVFKKFEIEVPKYPAAFISVGQNVPVSEVAEGDIVLFSRTDSVKKAVYQVGIVISEKGSPVSFIHASSGKMNGVGISALSSYYQKKVIGYRRVF